MCFMVRGILSESAAEHEDLADEIIDAVCTQ